MRFSSFARLSLLIGVLSPGPLRGDPIPVLKTQGTMHGFLTVRSLDGKLIGTGDLIQVAKGDRVTSRLTLHFRDGSLNDETTVFTQHKMFEFVSDHVVQRGPSFPDPKDVMVLANGDVTIRSLAKEGKEGETKVTTTHLDLPPDTYNGMIFNILTNLPPAALETKVAMVVPSGKGRVVHLSVKPEGQEPFRVGAAVRQSNVLRIHIDLGGITGVVAPLVGKQPDDIRIWLLPGEAPAILKTELQLYEGGPVLRMETTSPVWGGR